MPEGAAPKVLHKEMKTDKGGSLDASDIKGSTSKTLHP